MASEQGKLCSLIIKEHFGEVVAKVSSTLHWGPKTLALIISSSQLPPPKVKQALSVLIKYGFVTFEPGKIPTIAEYKFLPSKATLMLRYPRYISQIKQRLDEESSMLVEELLKYGCDTSTNTILRVNQKITQDNLKLDFDLANLRDKFHQLVTLQYLMRCPHPAGDTAAIEVPLLCVTETELYRPIDLDLKALSLLSQGLAAEDPGDKSVLWRINFDRFHQDARDELMIAAVSRRFDASAGLLMRELLRLMYLRTDAWVSQSNAIPVSELRESLVKTAADPYLTQYFDHFLKIIEDSTGWITRLESSAGLIEMNLSATIHQLTCCTIDHMVEQRCGAKAARIFRLVRAKKYIEQEQIQQLAMIPDKEAKYLTYKLLQDNLIQMQELRKPVVSSGPNKTFFLFHVDLYQVARMVLENCYKAMSNSIMRRSHEKNANIRLVEKQEKIEAIAGAMREQGTDEHTLQELVDDWLSPPERTLLESIGAMIKKLNLAELQIDDTIFILQLFTYYESASIRSAIKTK